MINQDDKPKYFTNTTYGHDSTKFGGIIYPDDFNTTYHPKYPMSDRILSDWKFDKECKRNILNRKYEKENKTNELQKFNSSNDK